ncbi:MAG: CHAP domain-containing protein [Clostridiales bacterium]|nr:CHAP domain-containing protein [Clostridiales bacterium]
MGDKFIQTQQKFWQKYIAVVLVFLLSALSVFAIKGNDAFGQSAVVTTAQTLQDDQFLQSRQFDTQAENVKLQMQGEKEDSPIHDNSSLQRQDFEPQPIDYFYDESKESDTRSGGLNNLNNDYFTSNILSVAKPGDIFIQQAGGLGITGHAGIVTKVNLLLKKVYTSGG